MGTPFITVVAIAHNRKEFINMALASAVNQTLSSSLYEIVVVTNVEIEQSFLENPSLRVIRCDEPNVGAKVVEALKQSSGDVVCFLEDDDVWDGKKLEVVYSLFSENPYLGFYHNGWEVIDEVGQLVDHPLHAVGRRAMARVGRVMRDAGDLTYSGIRSLISVNSDFNGSSISIRRNLLADRTDYLRRIRLNYDPFLFYAAVDSECSILSDSVILTKYRIHSHNYSLTSPNKQTDHPFSDLELIKEMIENEKGNIASLKSIDCLMNDLAIEAHWRTGVINRYGLLGLLVKHIRFLTRSELQYNTLLLTFATLYVLFPSIARALLSKIYPEQSPRI